MAIMSGSVRCIAGILGITAPATNPAVADRVGDLTRSQRTLSVVCTPIQLPIDQGQKTARDTPPTPSRTEATNAGTTGTASVGGDGHGNTIHRWRMSAPPALAAGAWQTPILYRPEQAVRTGRRSPEELRCGVCSRRRWARSWTWAEVNLRYCRPCACRSGCRHRADGTSDTKSSEWCDRGP